jgi:hypothetical protein
VGNRSLKKPRHDHVSLCSTYCLPYPSQFLRTLIPYVSSLPWPRSYPQQDSQWSDVDVINTFVGAIADDPARFIPVPLFQCTGKKGRPCEEHASTGHKQNGVDSIKRRAPQRAAMSPLDYSGNRFAPRSYRYLPIPCRTV